MDDTSTLALGMTVTGTGIPTHTYVSSITNGTTFELTNNATATNSNTTLTFKRNAPVPDSNYLGTFVGSFNLDAGATADDDYVTILPLFRIPQVKSAQRIDWYLRNIDTGQSVAAGWQLWIAPRTSGPQ